MSEVSPATETCHVADPEAMHELGVRLGRVLRAGDLVVLTGPLGAGKTTLTRGIGEGLGVRGPITSPTFVIARTHPSLVGAAPLIHADAYRLADAGELDDLDLDFEASVVVAEWGAGLLGDRSSHLEVTIARPTGAAEAPSQQGTAADPGHENLAGVEDETGTGDEPIEPRTVTITAYGVRWADGVLS